MIAPAIASPMPIRSIITPQIMLRIAIIVTPVGRDFGEDCTTNTFFFLVVNRFYHRYLICLLLMTSI
jgi:hypothetical protein